jgi:hypothetical protein
MKRNIFTMMVAALVSLFALTSCEKEPVDLIVGSWNLSTVKISMQGVTMDVDPSELYGINPTYTFAANGILTMTYEDEGELLSESYNYSVVDGDPAQLIIISDGESMPHTIKQLDNTTLILLAADEDTSIEMIFTRK